MKQPQAVMLAGIRAFAALDADARAEVAARATLHEVKAGTTVVDENATSRDVYFVVSGDVDVRVFSREGRHVAFRELGAGELFGDIAALDGEPRCANVQARSDCVLASMSPQHFDWVLDTRPGVARVIMEDLARLVRQLSERVVELSTLGVKNRIHAELLRLAHARGVEDNRCVLHSPPTHQEIASRVATHREAVTRELSALQRGGIVTRTRSELTLLDVARLEAMVSDVRSDAVAADRARPT